MEGLRTLPRRWLQTLVSLQLVNQEPTAGTGKMLAIVSLHVAVLIAACWFTLRQFEGLLLSGYDGAFYRTTTKLQYEWMSWAPHLGPDPVAAFGNSFFCVHTLYSPCLAIAAIIGNGELNPLHTYTIVALEMFLAVVFLGWCLRLRLEISLLAAWAFALSALPFFRRPPLYPIAYLAPTFFEFCAAQCVVIGAFVRIGKQRWLASAGFALLILALAGWGTVCSPMGLILCIPPVAINLILFTLYADDWKERQFKLAALAALLGAAVPTLVAYFVGNYLYSVPSFFTSELQGGRPPLWWISSLFHARSMGWFGPPLVCGGFAAAVLIAFFSGRPFRIIAIATFIQSVVNLGLGLYIVYGAAAYAGPAPIYFEIFLWPFYWMTIAFLVWVLCLGIKQLLVRLGASWPLLPSWSTFGLGVGYPIWLLPVIVAVLSTREPFKIIEYRFPPAETTIVQRLKNQLALHPGSIFRGCVATFTGFQGKTTGPSWSDLYVNDVLINQQTGNDHRAMGCWYHEIPTIHEYNQFMSPAYYAMMSRMLAHREDLQTRNVVVLTKPHVAYLRSLGVRFMITDYPFADPSVRLDQTMAAGPAGQSLYLYELENPNLANYSPTSVSVASSASESIRRLQDPTFEFADQAVAARPLSQNLQKATSSRCWVERDRLVVEASSPGTAVLLLPLQYSHCLDLSVIAMSPANTSPSLERLNLMQTGLLFSGTVKVEIRFANGPFHNQFGRAQDYLDMRKLRLKELVQGR